MTSPDGQSERVRSLLVRYAGRTVRYPQRLTGDLERACDVVQETFL